MAELNMFCPRFSLSISPPTTVATGLEVLRRVLVRIGPPLDANTTVNITSPGSGWVVSGDVVTFNQASDFTDLIQVYRNGVNQLTGASSSDNNDVYFVSASSNLAFEEVIQTNDVIQVWKFNPTTDLTVASTSGADIDKLVLIRTGGTLAANTTFDINNPGGGWVVFGDTVTFSGSTEFVELTQVFRNGMHQLTGASASDDNDVYFVAASGSIAFETSILTNDIIQVWKFTITTSG